MNWILKWANNELWIKVLAIWIEEYESNISGNELTIYLILKCFQNCVVHDMNCMNEINIQMT